MLCSTKQSIICFLHSCYKQVHINVDVFGLFFRFLSMSFNRVLPHLPALSDRDLARRSAVAPKADSLRSAKIMTDESSNSAFQENGRIPNLSAKSVRKSSSATIEDRRSSSPAEEEHRPSNLRQEVIPTRVRKPAPSNIEIWQGESPSQICLCQPDPKVPRPRNGKFSPLEQGIHLRTLADL